MYSFVTGQSFVLGVCCGDARALGRRGVVYLVEDKVGMSNPFSLGVCFWWMPIVGLGTLLIGVCVKGEGGCGARDWLQQGWLL